MTPGGDGNGLPFEVKAVAKCHRLFLVKLDNTRIELEVLEGRKLDMQRPIFDSQMFLDQWRVSPFRNAAFAVRLEGGIRNEVESRINFYSDKKQNPKVLETHCVFPCFTDALPVRG